MSTNKAHTEKIQQPVGEKAFAKIGEEGCARWRRGWRITIIRDVDTSFFIGRCVRGKEGHFLMVY